MIPTTDRKDTFIGNDTADSFDCAWRIFAKSNVVAKVIDSDGVVSDLSLTTHYTIPDADVNDLDGFTLSLVNGNFAWVDGDGDLATGYTLTIERVVPLTQTLNLSTNSNVSPSSIEVALDKIVSVQQQQQDSLDATFVLNSSEDPDDFDLTLPTVEERANTVFAWDEDGNPTTAELDTVGADPTASFVTISAESSLTNERRLTGTANQVTVTDNGAGGTVVLSTPQNIHSAATPTFGGLTINGATVLNEAGADADSRIEGDTATHLLVCDAGLDAVQIGTTVAGAIADFRTTGTVLNESGSDRDLRIEGVSQQNLVYLDAGLNRLGICHPQANAKVHVYHPTAANRILLLSSGAEATMTTFYTTDSLATTNATVTSLFTYTPAATTVITITATVNALKEDGNYNSGSGFVRMATFITSGAGAVTQVGSTASIYTVETDSNTDLTIDASAGVVRVRVTGVAATNYTWFGHIRIDGTVLYATSG